MSLACYCSRHRSVYLTLKLTKREQWKSLKEVQARRNIFRNRSNLLYYSARLVSGDGASSQTPKSEASKEPKDRPKESKESITKLLQNYKPANEQTEKILKMLKEKIGVNNKNLKKDWDKLVDKTLIKAKLKRPEDGYMMTGSRKGIHTEMLGKILSEMQYLPRAYPDAKW